MNERPEVVYHYCPPEAFVSIIENKCLWLSSINTCNDYSEVHHAFQLITEFLIKEYNAVSFVRFIKDNLITNLHPVNFCSFTTEKDDLSQWWGYGENGEGFCIGINTNIFPKNPYSNSSAQGQRSISDSMQFQKIIYDSATKKNHLSGIFIKEKVNQLEEFIKNKATFHEISTNEVFFELSKGMLNIIPIFKDLAFENENEWRLLVNYASCKHFINENQYTSDKKNEKITLSQKKHRLSKNGLTSYFEYPFYLKSSPIVDIILGPKNKSSIKMVSDFLITNNYNDFRNFAFKNINVEKSKIPYK